MKILIAEDEIISQKILQKMLAEYGACDCASDGAQAIEKIRAAYASQNPYQLLCIDVSMPNVDGFQVLQALKEIEDQANISEEKRGKAIMITSRDDKESFVAAIEKGSYWYLTKPVDKQALVNVLEELGF